eukprot:189136_1
MADHNPHAESLAYLEDQSKVTGFQMQQAEHVSKNPSDLQGIAEAQVVTTNAPSFKVDPDAPLDLQSGPAKKYIDNPDATVTTTTASDVQQRASVHTNDQTMISYTDQPIAASGVGSAIATETTQDQQGLDSFFGTATTDNRDDIFGAATNAVQNDDIFGDIDRKTDDVAVTATATEAVNVDDEEDEEDKKEQKQTFLSVWQEQHREGIADKVKQEREAQDKQIETAKEALEQFNEERRMRVEQGRKQAQAMESDLREDYNAVFKHGTIWQQVAKLVDLKTKKENIERMRDLLIILKNKDDKQSK